MKVLCQSFDWFNVARFWAFLVKRNDIAWRCLYRVLSRYLPINIFIKTKNRLIDLINVVNQQTGIAADLIKLWSIALRCFPVHVVPQQGCQAVSVQHDGHCITKCFCELLVHKLLEKGTSHRAITPKPYFSTIYQIEECVIW